MSFNVNGLTLEQEAYIPLYWEKWREISFSNLPLTEPKVSEAVKFPDGYSLYFYRNISIPKKYGRKSPEKWHTRWLLKRKNDELRRIILKEIGYQYYSVKDCQPNLKT